MTRTTTLAVAADYADALMTARRAKNWLFILLMLFVVAELALFLLVRFDVLKLEDRAGITPSAASTPAVPSASAAPAASIDASGSPTLTPATGPTTETTDFIAGGTTTPPAVTPAAVPPAVPAPARPTHTVSVDDIVRYVIPLIDFLGIALAVVLSVVLLLLTAIMLVGRLIGVSHVTSAFIWSVVLVVLLFPWQAFLIASENYTVTPGVGHEAIYGPQPAFKFPGVLYTYPELRQDLYRSDPHAAAPDSFSFAGNSTPTAVLKWARYVALPLVALFLLFMIQAKSGRGLRFALGESDIQVEVTNRSGDPIV